MWLNSDSLKAVAAYIQSSCQLHPRIKAESRLSDSLILVAGFHLSPKRCSKSSTNSFEQTEKQLYDWPHHQLLTSDFLFQPLPRVFGRLRGIVRDCKWSTWFLREHQERGSCWDPPGETLIMAADWFEKSFDLHRFKRSNGLRFIEVYGGQAKFSKFMMVFLGAEPVQAPG